MANKWVLFWDMHSGGGQKHDFALCFVEASSVEEAVAFFTERYHDPHHVTCNCCGQDYAIHDSDTFEEATKFHRESGFRHKMNQLEGESLDDWVKRTTKEKLIKVFYRTEREITAAHWEEKLVKEGEG